MPVLCKLADPRHYQPFSWSLLADPRDLAYWLGLFEGFTCNIEQHLREDHLGGEDFEARWAEFCREYQAGIEAFRRDPHVDGGVTTFTLVCFRRAMLNKFGWPDPYVLVKQRANEQAVRLYPRFVRRIDDAPPHDRWELLMRGLFAGNMFDLGAPETAAMYNAGSLDFHTLLKRVPPRPWFIDHVDALRERFQRRAYRQALFFVDNAGSDITLGVVPLAREMARSGINVVLAANSTPALNDITIDELNPLLQRIAGVDTTFAELLASGRISALASGNGSPLIDLGTVSEECNDAAAESDLIVLEGMGRGVESNWQAAFTCDAWRIAAIKDESVARWVGSRMFDVICRLSPAIPLAKLQELLRLQAELKELQARAERLGLKAK